MSINTQTLETSAGSSRRFKACFVISTTGPGKGGHCKSLKTTVESLVSQIDCTVIHAGVKASPILNSIPAVVHFVPFYGYNLWRAIRRIWQIVKDERPDVINTFDVSAHFFGHLTALRYRLPLVTTKCGGPNPAFFFPRADRIIVYSQENYQYFTGSREFSGTPVYCIPNRVRPFTCNPAQVAAFRRHLDGQKPCFLRINRFISCYEDSMRQAIALVQRLNRQGCPCQLAIVGAIEQQDVYDRVRAVCDDTVRLFVEEEFTHDARHILDAVDFVIGTGRGFMEAACCGKGLLTPLESARYPALVTEDNFEQVFATNFSPRNRIADYNEEENYQRIVEAVRNPEYRAQLKRQALFLFDRYFDMDAAAERYISVLQTSCPEGRRIRPFQLGINGLLCVNRFLRRRS